MFEADQCNNRLADPREEDGADEGPRNGSREGEVVVCASQLLVDVGSWSPVHKYIVRGLDVEGLFNLCVRRDQEMKQNQSGY